MPDHPMEIQLLIRTEHYTAVANVTYDWAVSVCHEAVGYLSKAEFVHCCALMLFKRVSDISTKSQTCVPIPKLKLLRPIHQALNDLGIVDAEDQNLRFIPVLDNKYNWKKSWEQATTNQKARIKYFNDSIERIESYYKQNPSLDVTHEVLSYIKMPSETFYKLYIRCALKARRVEQIPPILRTQRDLDIIRKEELMSTALPHRNKFDMDVRFTAKQFKNAQLEDHVLWNSYERFIECVSAKLELFDFPQNIRGEPIWVSFNLFKK